jgi:hypothetical protein
MLAFTTDDLAKIFRAEVGDEITDVEGRDEDRLWKQWEVFVYMTEAINAVLDRTDVKQKVIELPVIKGQRDVRCPSYITEIRSITRVSDGYHVDQLNANSLMFGIHDDYGLQARGYSELNGTATGRADVFVRDYIPGFLRLVSIPAEDDVLRVQCVVKLSVPLECGMPLPIGDIEDQRLALEYMKARAYRKHDAETEDLVRATSAERWFEAKVEERKSKLRNNRRSPGAVRMEW